MNYIMLAGYSALSALLSLSAYGHCQLEKTSIGWTSQITFQCDQITNLTQNPIHFQVDGGVSVQHAWGLNAPTSAITQGNNITIQTGQTWWPKKDLIIPAQHPVTISFSPSKIPFNIGHFYVGTTHPAEQGTITFKADTHSRPIPANTDITLTPSNTSQNNGYHFTWHTVQSGLAQVIKAGTYVVTVHYPDHNIIALPSDVTVMPNRGTNVILNDQPYPGSLTFALDHNQPHAAPNVTIHINDETAHAQYTLSLPWDNHAQTYQNLQLNHHYRFSADNLAAANTKYHFTFTPTSITLCPFGKAA